MADDVQTQPPAPGDAHDASPKRRVPRRRTLPWWRRVLRGLGFFAVGVLVVVVGLVLALLYSPSFDRFAVTRGVALYDGMIPGSASVSGVEGSLADALVLHDVVLTDATGHELVRAQTVSLGIDVGRLPRRTVRVPYLHLVEADVRLPPPGSNGFGDLAPPRKAPPPPPDPNAPLGPNLPFGLDVELHAERVRLFRPRLDTDPTEPHGARADPEPDPWVKLVDVSELRALLHAAGTDATLELDTSAEVPVAGDLEVSSLHLDAAWNSPRLAVPELEVASSWGEVSLANADVDFDALAGSLEKLRVEADRDWFEHTTTLRATAPPTVMVEGGGSLDGLDVSVRADVPGHVGATLTVDGKANQEVDATLALDVVASPHALVDALKPEQATASLRLRAVGSRDTEIVIDGGLRCTDCDPHGDPVRLDVQATVGPEEKTAHADLGLLVATTEANVEAEIIAGNEVDLVASVRSPSLSRVADVVGHFVARPDLAGRADLDLACGGTLDPRDLHCDVKGGVSGGRPVEYARLDVGATLRGDDLVADIRQLGVRTHGVSVTELGGPAHVKLTLGEPAVAFDDLTIQVATEKGEGRLSASGALDPQGHSDLLVRLHAVDLAAANAFVPGLGIRGSVQGQLTAAGPPSDLRVRGELSTTPVTMKGQRIGALDTTLRVADGQADVQVDVRGGTAGDLTATARAPFDLDLDAGDVGPRGGPWTFDLSLVGAQLDELAQLAPDPLPLVGNADVDIHVRGGARPTIGATVRGRALGWDGKPIGDLDVNATYNERVARLDLSLDHPDARAITVEAQVPVVLALPVGKPTVRWQARKAHRAVVKVNDLDLRAANAWVPEHQFGGNLDVYLAVRGDMYAPVVDLEVGVRAASMDDKEIGTVELRGGYAEQRAVVIAKGHGPLFDRLELDAEVPVTLTPGRRDRPFAWDDEAPHALKLGLGGIQLSKAKVWAPDLPPLDGRGIVSLDLSGTPHEPELVLDVALANFSYEDKPVGDVSVHATLDQRLATADVLLRHDALRKLSAYAAVPVVVDPLDGEFDWRRKDPHELHVAAEGVDNDFLAAFVDFPEQLEFDAGLEIDGEGNIDEFSVQGLVDGGLAIDGRRQAFEGNLEVHPQWQSVNFALGGGAAGSLSLDLRTEVPASSVLPPPPDATDTSRKENPGLMHAPIALAFSTDAFALDLISPLMPPAVYDLRGAFTSKVNVEGTVGSPRFEGMAKLDEGEVTVVPVRQRYEHVRVDLDFDDDGAELTKLHLDAGQGTLDATGEVHIANGGLSARVKLEADDMPFEKPGIPRMSVDSRIVTELELDAKRTDVKVHVKKTTVDVKGTNVPAPTDIPQTGAVAYVNLDANEVERQLAGIVTDEALAELMPDEPEPKKTEEVTDPEDGFDAPWLTLRGSRNTGIIVKVDDPIQIRGPAIDMAWDGRVEVEMGPKGVATTGTLDAERGTFELLSNQFTVTRGVVTIPPGNDVIPFIDLIATTQIDEYEITASIKGRVTRPEFHLTSVPAADEATIFGMLVSGTSNPEQGPNAAKQAASVLAAFSNPALQRKLSDKVGVDKVGLSFGETASQPILTVGKHLAKDVYVETQYQFGADPSDPTANKAQVDLRYRFAPQWSLETYFGDAPAGGLGVFWGRSYDVRTKPYWIDQSALRPRRRKDADALTASPEDVERFLPDVDGGPNVPDNIVEGPDDDGGDDQGEPVPAEASGETDASAAEER